MRNPLLNRRQFLHRSVGTTGLGWVISKVNIGSPAASSSQEVPSRATYTDMILDTHTHFYDPTRPQGVPWPPADDKLLYRRVLPADYKALPKPSPVTGTVVVEASAWLEDNQWILDLAAKDPFIVGFVGHLDVGRLEFSKNLDRFARNRVFRGLRIGADQLAQGLQNPQFISDLRLMAARGLALDLLGGPDMLPDVSRLADKVPDLRMIIDHVANLRIDGKSPEPRWTEGMREAGKHPKVYCKVSGLVEGSGHTDGHAPADVQFYKPILDGIWEYFGQDRLVYGSNWPVSERFAPCAVVQQIVADYFVPKGKSIVEKVFVKNGLALYGVSL